MGQGPDVTFYRALDGTARGRATGPEAEAAAAAFRNAMQNDPVQLGDSFPLLLRQANTQGPAHMDLNTLASLHPRSMEFIRIEASKENPVEFQMGSPPTETGRSNDETLHTVKLTKSFEVAATNVTVGVYRRVMGRLPSRYSEEAVPPRDDEPLRYLSWNRANDFIKKLNDINPDKTKRYRMLTEAEWEAANRLNQNYEPFQSAFPWGNVWSDAHGQTRPTQGQNQIPIPLVDSHQTTGQRFAGMNGEVWQWTRDTYAPDYGGIKPINENPENTQAGPYRLLRGGSFWDYPRAVAPPVVAGSFLTTLGTSTACGLPVRTFRSFILCSFTLLQFSKKFASQGSA
jgi:hypothetical protein